jgi:hypothetical protein
MVIRGMSYRRVLNIVGAYGLNNCAWLSYALLSDEYYKHLYL